MYLLFITLTRKKCICAKTFFKHYIIKVTFQSVADHTNLKNSGIFCQFQNKSFFSFLFPRHNLLFCLHPSWPRYNSQGKIHKIFSSFYVLSFAFFTRSCHDIQPTSEKSMSSSKGFDLATKLLGQHNFHSLIRIFIPKVHLFPHFHRIYTVITFVYSRRMKRANQSIFSKLKVSLVSLLSTR